MAAAGTRLPAGAEIVAKPWDTTTLAIGGAMCELSPRGHCDICFS